jgi:hypothetical protein
MVAVSQVMPGFDWTHGRLIFRTVDPVVPCKILKKKISDFARERLAIREDAHRKIFGGRERGGEYTPKTHRQPWIAGFIDGVRWHITGVDLGDIGVGALGDEWVPQDEKEAAAVQRCLHRLLAEIEVKHVFTDESDPLSTRIAHAEASGLARACIVAKRLLARVSKSYGYKEVDINANTDSQQ